MLPRRERILCQQTWSKSYQSSKDINVAAGKFHESMASENKAPELEEVPRQRFDVQFLLDVVFSDMSSHDLASYLVSKDPMPPTGIPTDIVQKSVNFTSLIISDQNAAVILLKRTNPAFCSGDQDFDSSGLSSHNHALNQQTPAKGEYLFSVPHSVTDNYAYFTCTDCRTPLAFMEPASPPVPGLRRAVLLKLDKMGYPHSYAIYNYYNLQDGKSSMSILVYTLEPEIYSEKHFVLFRPYPSYRFPRFDDVLESLVACEIPSFCAYCVARGYTKCGCAAKIRERMKPLAPPRTNHDCWELIRWTTNVYELGIKKNMAFMKNTRFNISFATAMFCHGIASTPGQGSHDMGLQGYLSEVRPFLESRAMARTSDMLLAPNALLDQARALRSSKVRSLTDRPSSFMVQNQEAITTAGDTHLKIRSNELNNDETIVGKHISNSKQTFHESVPASSDSIPEVEKSVILTYLEEVRDMAWSPGQMLTCKLCQAPIARKHDLKRHILSKHAHERAHECKLCGLVFTRSAHLEMHVKSKHEKDWFICQHCQRAFSYASAMRRHVKSQHSEKES